jgi:Ras-related protein Rab-11A
MQDGKRIKAQIWDTAGQERYRAITNAYYRGALGAVIVYDVTSRSTFDNITRWLGELSDHAHRDIILFLVGNKIDLIQDSTATRAVTVEEADALAQQYEMSFAETSAKTGDNVAIVFQTLVSQIYEKNLTLLQNNRPDPNYYPTRGSQSVSVDGDNGNDSQRKCCK